MDNPTSGLRLRHIAPLLVVTDVVRTAEYYRDILGFTIGGCFGSPPVFTMVSPGPVWIQLGRRDTEEVTRNLSVRKLGHDGYI
jgi:hypothetical protein